MKNLFIDILAFGTLLSSVLVITSKNPIIAVIFLISVFCNAAGYLILLGVGFVGISYIIVYVGAITVLFLFVIMMINIKLTDILETGSQYTKNLPLAIAIGSLFIYEIFTIMPFSFNNVSGLSSLLENLTSLNGLLLNSDTSSITSVFNAFNPTTQDTTFTNFLQVEALGHGLYTYGAILLIISSVILLLAMVAPIFISRTSK
jgi:NADH-ubiquinone oxidoreductase chain 6